MVRSLVLLTSFVLFQPSCFTQAKDTFLPSLDKKEVVKKTPKKDFIKPLKVLGGIVIPMFVLGECIMYTNFVKATYQWLTHGKEIRSFFAKPPAGATYSLSVTIKRFGVSTTRSFTSQNPHTLIKEADAFAAEYIKKEYPNDLLVRILLEPAIITKQGRKITLNPFYNLWDAQQGIAPELYKKFFTTAQSNADQVFEALQSFTIGSVMTLTAPLLIAAAYRLRGAFCITPLPLAQ